MYEYQVIEESNGSDFDPRSGKYSKMKTVSLPGNISNISAIPWVVAKLSLPIKEGTSKVLLAIHEQGACIILNSFVVTYTVCPGKVLPGSLLLVPQTVAPTNESAIVKVSGKCVANSDATSQELDAFCGTTGDWILPDSTVAKEVCLCNPGWENSVAGCQGTDLCPVHNMFRASKIH